MKYFLITFMLMTGLSSMAQSGEATTVKKTFSRTTTVSVQIKADASIVWTLLTNANDFSRWNSTVISIDGEIQEGEKIKLKSTLDPSRTFKLKVREMTANRKMIWGDAMGKRTYLLEASAGGLTFTMTEKIGSFLFPLFAGKIPSFDESFEQFAADLKKEAEIIANSK